MTTPYIFPGLKQPTSQLYFDLQAFIAANGGRFRLAKLLEDEISGTYRQHNFERNYQFWLPKEIEFVKLNYPNMTCRQLAKSLKISYYRVRWMVSVLRERGEVELKYNIKKCR